MDELQMRYPLLTEDDLLDLSLDLDQEELKREEESIARHVATCKKDGFCYICQCL